MNLQESPGWEFRICICEEESELTVQIDKSKGTQETRFECSRRKHMRRIEDVLSHYGINLAKVVWSFCQAEDDSDDGQDPEDEENSEGEGEQDSED